MEQNKFLDPHQFSGLKPHVKSKKDYSHAKTFGVAPLTDLPAEYLLVSTILDQGNLPHCTAYSACAIHESSRGLPFDAEEYYKDEGIVAGQVSDTGYDIRIEMATATKVGLRPLAGGNKADYKDDAFFAIDGVYDLFDNVRSAMWLAKDEKRCAQLGTMWFNEWTFSPGGIIPTIYSNAIGLHALKCAGWKTINGVLYMALQNSYGTGYGDNGLFYFPREVFNKEFKEGNYCWRVRPDPSEIKRLSAILTLYYRIVQLLSQLVSSQKTMPIPPQPPITPPTPPKPPENKASAYSWDNPINAKHSVRVICDEEGLSVNDKNIMCACVQVESGFNPLAEHGNKGADGKVWSTDYGICQVNDYYHIGVGKDFPSVDYVLNNPEACIRWMAKLWKAGKQNLWSSYTSGAYKKYL